MASILHHLDAFHASVADPLTVAVADGEVNPFPRREPVRVSEDDVIPIKGTASP
jgi:hypothetical protein